MKNQPGLAKKCRPIHRFGLMAASLMVVCGCEGAQKMTARLHAHKQASSTNRAAPAPAPTTRPTLEVRVAPEAGISLLIDGKRVADTSPWISSELTPGRHVLHVRAMGYHSVTLPVELAPGQHLTVPVALRPRPSTEAHEVPAQPQAQAVASPSQGGPRLAPTTRARLPSAPLPAGARAMILHIELSPPGPLAADGEAVAGPQVRLAHGRGELMLAGVVMPYRIHPGHVLELTVPHDEAAWFRDGSQVKATSRLRLEGRPMQLRRVDRSGTMLEATLRRLE